MLLIIHSAMRWNRGRSEPAFARPPLKALLLHLLLIPGWLAFPHPLSDSKSGSVPVVHGLRGKVIDLDSQPLSRIRVHLARNDGSAIGFQTVGYDGNFAFDNLVAGRYLLTLERENAPTIGRSVSIQDYPTPKAILLEIRLDQESSTSVREIVTELTPENKGEREHKPGTVSRRALKAFQRAVEAGEHGDRAKAIEYLERAIREQPNYFEAYNNLGVQHRKLRQWKQAIAAFERAIELRNDSAKPYLNLGTVYWELGHTPQAISNFEAALRLDEDSLPAHSALGQLFFRTQNYVKAQEHLETAARLRPTEARSAFLMLIQLGIINQDPDRARQHLQVMLQYFPGDAEALKLQETLKPGTKQ
jgi:Tfp pilus assembly protein PilF